MPSKKNSGKNSGKTLEGAVRQRGEPHPENLTPWKPGQSGNPKGRPKHAKLLQDEINKIMEEECFIKKEKTGELAFPGMTGIRAFVRGQYRLAMAGNARSSKEIWERVGGKVPLPIMNPDGTNLGSNPFADQTLEALRALEAEVFGGNDRGGGRKASDHNPPAPAGTDPDA